MIRSVIFFLAARDEFFIRGGGAAFPLRHLVLLLLADFLLFRSGLVAMGGSVDLLLLASKLL